MANNIANSIINGTYGKKEEEKRSIKDQILTGTFTSTSSLPLSNMHTTGNVKIGRIGNTNKALATSQNLGLLVGKGAVQAGEGILDFTNYLSDKVNSSLYDLLGKKDMAEKERKNKQNFIQRSLTTEFGENTGLSSVITRNEKSGALATRNNLIGQVAQAVGGQLPTLAVGGLSGVGKSNVLLSNTGLKGLQKVGATTLVNLPTTTTLGARSFGGALEEAFNSGATESEAVKYAIGSTATEIATEWITGGIPGTSGKGGLDYFADKGIDKISNQLIKDLVKYGYKMVGEGVEEGIAEIISPILKNATYSSGEKINWSDVLNSAIVGALSAGIIEAPNTIRNISNDIKQNNNKLPTVNDLVKKEKNTNSNDIVMPTVNDFVKNSNYDIDDGIKKQRVNGQWVESPNSNNSFVTNNIPQSNQNVQSSILPITNSTQVKEKNTSNFNYLSNEQQAKITELDNEFKRLKAIAEAKFLNDKTTRNKRIKSYAMEIAAKKREIIQGDWLIPIEGGLTPIELSKKIEKLKSNYVGKQVTVNGENAKIIGNSYGKIGVEFADGTRKYVEKSEITPVNDIDATISEQKKIMIQKNYQSTLNQNITEQQKKQTKGNIPINQELLNKNIKKYTEKEISNIKSERIQIAKSDNDIKNFVEEAINTKSSNKTIYFGKVNDELAKQIYEKIGINVKDYNLSLKAGNIKKILKDHGNPKTEALRGQIAISKDDFKYIDDIILENDNFFSSGTTEQGKTSITFEKNLDGKYMLVEYISDKHHNLEVQTMWKNKKKNSVTVLHDSNPGLNTSKTGSDTSSLYANNIPQSNENVKSSILPITNNTQNSENNTINMPPVGNKNISHEPEKLATILKERPVILQEKTQEKLLKLVRKTLDRGDEINRISLKTKNRELLAKYDYMQVSNSIAQQIIGNERFNPKTQKSEGSGLYKIFEPIENSGQLQEFSEYIYHKHNISRMSLNTLFQEDNKPIFGNGVTSENSKNIVEKYESENPEFIEWAQEIYDYNNFLLDVLVDYGVISSEDKTYYNNKYPYYVPIIRATDKTKTNMDFIGKKASVNTPIKKAKGGNQDIIPLKEAMALRTMQTINSALRNNFGTELLNTIETETETSKVNIDDVVGDDIDAEEFLTKSTKKAPATLTVFQNGEKITFEINDGIYEALQPLEIFKIKPLNTLGNIKRALVTEYRPTFILNNPIKDIQDGILNTKHPIGFIKNFPKVVLDVVQNGPMTQLYIANGGGHDNYFDYGKTYNKIPSKKKWYNPLKFLDIISTFNRKVEMAPRITEMVSSIEAGESMETAMYNAAEITTNFKKGGVIVKTLDANGAIFLNAGTQGAMKQIRNFQEARAEGIKGMTNLAVRWAIVGLPLALLNGIIWGEEDEYEEISDYIKNNYYILWINNDGTFVRIPKGRVVSVIQNLFKQSLESLKGEKIDVEEFVDLLRNQVLPSNPYESNIFSPFMDVMQNKTWYGGDLVPQRLQSLPEEEQYDESTDSISIWLGEKMGISPKKINYLLQQNSGVIGEMILPALTLEAENDSNSLLSYLTGPLKDKYMGDVVFDNQNISDLYDLDDKLTKKSKSSNATTEDILKSKYINSIQTEMNKLTAEKRNIQNDKTLTNNEKYKQVREIQKQINELAKKGLSNYEKVELYDNYAKVGDIEYYKNSSDEWQKLDTTTSKYKTIKQITTYDKYLTYQNKIDDLKDNYDNTTQRKNAVIKYVNSLNLSIPQKAMLIKLNYSSFNSYNKQIVQYINKQDLTKAEKTEILTKLGFTVKDGRVYY